MGCTSSPWKDSKHQDILWYGKDEDYAKLYCDLQMKANATPTINTEIISAIKNIGMK